MSCFWLPPHPEALDAAYIVPGVPHPDSCCRGHDWLLRPTSGCAFRLHIHAGRVRFGGACRTDSRGSRPDAALVGDLRRDGERTRDVVMHYTGMLSFSLPVPVLYDWPTVVISFLPAVVSAAVALFLINSWNLRWGRALAGSIFIGGGIATMHYTGMAAMRFEGRCRYSPSLVALSVILAILFLLMKLTILFRDEATPPWLRKAGSILLLGAANPVMHYTGMAATTFLQSSELPDVSHAVSVSILATEAITIVPIMVLAVAAVTSVVDRLREQGALLERALDAALEASRVKSAFIANTSHEIRTPLNIITGYVDLIGEHLAAQNDESLKGYMEGTRRACVRLLRTIGNMLDISKIEA